MNRYVLFLGSLVCFILGLVFNAQANLSASLVLLWMGLASI